MTEYQSLKNHLHSKDKHQAYHQSRKQPYQSIKQNHQYSHTNTTSAIIQDSSNPQPIQQQIKQHLKAFMQQKDYMKKLMISCILSSLYIEQYNYQEAHKILTDMQKTISKLQEYSKTNPSKLNHQDQLELAIIKLKMYSNCILIEIINLQVQLFEQHLEQALELIENYKNKWNKHHLLPEESSSENIDPNQIHKSQSQKQQLLNTMVMLFQLFLKGFSGFQSFEKIQGQTLIAQCHMQQQPCSNIQRFFYFSNISFLKLLSTSDYQAAYKLQSSAYEFIQTDIETSRRNRQPINLKQVILRTVCLKKLLYLSEQLKLPTQIIKKYKQKLNSTKSLQSKFLQGLQQNTIFRNYNQKIQLGFKLVSRLKEFEKQVILPVVLSTQTNRSKSRQLNTTNGSRLKLWQCKALKNKFVQVLGSKALQSDQKAQQNILLVVQCLNKTIQRQQLSNHISQTNSIQIPVEQLLLLESIGYTKDRPLHSNKNKKSQSNSLYNVAISEYNNRLQVFCQSISKNIINPLMLQFLQNLQEFQQPEIQVEITHGHQDKQNQEQINGSQTQSEPSIYLENVQFQVIKQHDTKQDRSVQQKISHKHESYSRSQQKQKQQIPKYKIPQKLSSPIHKQKIVPSRLTPEPYNYNDKTKKSPRKNIFLNQKNQVYMNYAQLGSRVKLQQHKPPQQSKYSTDEVTSRYQTFQDIKTKKSYHQESIKKEQGEIEIPHEDSVVKYGAKKYPFEEKESDLISPLSHQVKYSNRKQKQSIFQTFNKHQKPNHSFSNVIETQQEQKSVQQTKSISKSRKKQSSLSPRIPKDSTINSRLNEHIKRHQLTYSPQSMTSGLKQNKSIKQGLKLEQKDKSISDYSADLSPSSRSMTKNRPKVQKASLYPKSPISSSNPLQAKTIKFKQYMQNLEKSGINIKEEQPSKNTSSRPKIESKSGHRRIATQTGQIQSQKYESYMNQTSSKVKVNQGKSILEGFFADPKKKQKPVDIFENSPSDKGSSPEDKHMKMNLKSEIPKAKRTSSQLISLQQSPLMSQQPLRNQQSKNIFQKQVTKSIVTSNKSQPNPITKTTIQSKQPSPMFQMLLPQTIKEYILKMMKGHKQKLNHAIRLCQNGQYVDKKHYSSDGGDERFLQLSSDHKFIEWAVSQNKLLQGQKSKYEIKYVKGVVFGRVTDTMKKLSNRHLEPYKCISFIFQKRTFDIYCPDEQDVLFWLPGISCFISQVRPQLNHPNYTTKIEKFIKKRQVPVKKDDLHANTTYYSMGRVLWKRMLLKMQSKYLKQKKTNDYKNANAGAIIEFNKAVMREKQAMKYASMLPPTGKQSKMSREKSISVNSKMRN